MYFECVTCPKIGTVCDGPNFLAMPSKDLLEWCKQRKTQLRWSNAKLAEESNVPKGTIDRIFSANPMDFKFETIRPVLKALVGGSWGENPCGATDDSTTEPLLQKICELEEENNKFKDNLKTFEERHDKIVNYFRTDSREKIDFLIKELTYSKTVSRALKRTCIVLGVITFALCALIVAALVVDHFNPGMGFFWSR